MTLPASGRGDPAAPLVEVVLFWEDWHDGKAEADMAEAGLTEVVGHCDGG